MKKTIRLSYHSHKERMKKAVKVRRKMKYLSAKKKKIKHSLSKLTDLGAAFFSKPLTFKKKSSSYHCPHLS